MRLLDSAISGACKRFPTPTSEMGMPWHRVSIGFFILIFKQVESLFKTTAFIGDFIILGSRLASILSKSVSWQSSIHFGVDAFKFGDVPLPKVPRPSI